MTERFQDRCEAGALLAERLRRYAGRDDVIVLALPRGGVPVAHAVAAALEAPLDVFVVRKLGAPWNEELAIGAVASGGIRILDSRAIRTLGISRDEIDRITAATWPELARRERLYHGRRPFPNVAGKVVLLVDDGLATGSTMCAAVRALRTLGPRAVVAAVPVAASDACARVARVADACVCVRTPEPFDAVGSWYRDFSQTTDQEVLELLARSEADRPPSRAHRPGSERTEVRR